MCELKCISFDYSPVSPFCRFIRTQVASSLFLQHNDALVPPYRVLIDTNFINFSLQNKLELIGGMMDCLYAKCEYLPTYNARSLGVHVVDIQFLRHTVRD